MAEGNDDLPGDNGNRMGRLERAVAVIANTQGTIEQTLVEIKSVLRGLQEAREVNWPLILSLFFGSATTAAILLGGLWVITTMQSEAIVSKGLKPLEIEVAVAARERERLIAAIKDNTERLTTLRVETQSFKSQTLMTMVEIESQFKNLGQKLNSDRATIERKICELQGRPCPELFYFPEIGRTVNGPNGK
jgi:hypothetical protein